MRITRVTFIVGIIIAILVSSLMTVGVVRLMRLVEGPKGDKGDAGDKGDTGENGLSRIPYAEVNVRNAESNSTINADITGANVSIVTDANSSLLIVFSVTLYLVPPPGWSGVGYLIAVVDGDFAYPTSMEAITVSYPDVSVTRTDTFVFTKAVVGSGTHTVKMQWSVPSGFMIALSPFHPDATLAVWALPTG